jgi:hypothetical protein
MQLQCDPGVIIFGHKGDARLQIRPNWTKNGSLLAFRKLRQYVPEFDQFVAEHPAPPSTLPDEWSDLPADKRSDLTGARIFGRWKSVSGVPGISCIRSLMRILHGRVPLLIFLHTSTSQTPRRSISLTIACSIPEIKMEFRGSSDARLRLTCGRWHRARGPAWTSETRQRTTLRHWRDR